MNPHDDVVHVLVGVEVGKCGVSELCPVAKLSPLEIERQNNP